MNHSPTPLEPRLASFLKAMPKAELHIHIEGSLEPEMIFQLAKRNGIALDYPDVDALRQAYNFTDLQSFLDVYYAGAGVLQTQQDFEEMMWGYLQKAHKDGVVRAEIFFDPQTHTMRGVAMETVIHGLHLACTRAANELGIQAELILCFLRHLSQDEAFATLEEALPFRDKFIGVGLDSSELDHPPQKFQAVFARCRELGLHVVAHAGEEGPVAYVESALDDLKVERIDHGVQSIHSPSLMQRLLQSQIPLTVCPLSNIKLCVYDSLTDHPIAKMLDQGVCVTINSDDPAYFGGYLLDNFRATFEALHLDIEQAYQLARNSLVASFASEANKRRWLSDLHACFLAHQTEV